MPIEAVLFDCDGTLLDTAADLTHATNYIRKTQGLAPIDLSTTRPIAGNGAKALLASGGDINESQLNTLSQDLFRHYSNHIYIETCLFDGMAKVLTEIVANGLTWGIVTNRPEYLTHALLDHIALPNLPACIVCGDTLPLAKPHPDPIYHACKLIQVAPENCLYVGDNIRDIQAGNAAGSITVGALYGYLAEGEDVKQWQADYYIKQPSALLEILDF